MNIHIQAPKNVITKQVYSNNQHYWLIGSPNHDICYLLLKDARITTYQEQDNPLNQIYIYGKDIHKNLPEVIQTLKLNITKINDSNIDIVLTYK